MTPDVAHDGPSVDPAIPLGSDESVDWVGRPRLTALAPSFLVGLALVAVGLALAVATGDPVPALGGAVIVLVGIAIPAVRTARVCTTQFVVTDRALYAKHGVVGRTVSQANLETVQNSGFSQSVTGTLFGYGSVAFEIAGGEDLVFAEIHDPGAVRALVDHATRNTDGIDGARHRDSIPGTLSEWRSVRDEVHVIRQLLDENR